MNPARDEMEIAAVHEAVRRGMPILAICRGIQVLNVALGGTLWQDVPVAAGRRRAARAAGRDRRALARGAGGAGERAGAHLRDGHAVHQLVPPPGRARPGRRRWLATVWAEDGLVEGVEGREHPWMYGVQWHPERGEAHTPAGDERDPDRRLFWAFVQAAREFADGAGDGSDAGRRRADDGGRRMVERRSRMAGAAGVRAGRGSARRAVAARRGPSPPTAFLLVPRNGGRPLPQLRGRGFRVRTVPGAASGASPPLPYGAGTRGCRQDMYGRGGRG